MKYDKRLERNSDSIFTHIFARTFSRKITPNLANTNITPLQITLSGLIIGIFSITLTAKNGFYYCLTAAIGIEVSHILDCIDGELARITDRGSKFAAYIDPISDRFKDILIIFFSSFKSLLNNNFELNTIYFISFFSISLWLFYIYIVDAYLNPTQTEKQQRGKKRLYLGLYDLFIYGAIISLLLNKFEFFFIYALIISMIGIPIQIIKLYNLLNN